MHAQHQRRMLQAKAVSVDWGYLQVFIVTWTLSVPQSLQFYLSYALGKFETNIAAYFCAKWRPSFIYP